MIIHTTPTAIIDIRRTPDGITFTIKDRASGTVLVLPLTDQDARMLSTFLSCVAAEMHTTLSRPAPNN